MRSAPRNFPPSGRPGFTLIEIVVAIGVIAFAGVALVGLLGVGLNSSREASEESASGLIARYVFTILETEALSAEDLSPTEISPFKPGNITSSITKSYYFTRDGAFLGNTFPSSPNPGGEPYFLAEAVIAPPASALAAGVANQGVSPKELRSVALKISWPLVLGTGLLPAKAKSTDYSFLLSKKIYRRVLEGDR